MTQEKKVVGARGLVSLSPATIENIADKTAERVVRKMKDADGRRHEDLLVCTREAAKMLGISPATLRRRVMDYPHKLFNGTNMLRNAIRQYAAESAKNSSTKIHTDMVYATKPKMDVFARTSAT